MSALLRRLERLELTAHPATAEPDERSALVAALVQERITQLLEGKTIEPMTANDRAWLDSIRAAVMAGRLRHA